MPSGMDWNPVELSQLKAMMGKCASGSTQLIDISQRLHSQLRPLLTRVFLCLWKSSQYLISPFSPMRAANSSRSLSMMASRCMSAPERSRCLEQERLKHSRRGFAAKSLSTEGRQSEGAVANDNSHSLLCRSVKHPAASAQRAKRI